MKVKKADSKKETGLDRNHEFSEEFKIASSL